MSALLRRVANLDHKIHLLHKMELIFSTRSPQRYAFATARWALMLTREFLADDVKVRAESLAYLMAFSLLPLIAGAFFIFTIFTQFGMVQEALSNFMDRFLDNIPEEHRDTIFEYTIQFKDAYLAAINGKSGRLGIFSLLVLFWVGLQTFNNLDRTINFIWSSEQERPWIEKIRNFVVTAVGAPFVLIASLSIPLVLHKLDATAQLFETFPVLGSLLNQLIPTALILATFTCIYRYVPVRKVRWKWAALGGVFAGVSLQVVNMIISLYFKIGTNTAYGKAAMVPILGFWIYLVWIIVIMGAETSYLAQNQKAILRVRGNSPTLLESEGVLSVLDIMQKAHFEGKSPLSLESVADRSQLPSIALRRVLDYLEDQKYILRCYGSGDSLDTEYTLARDIGPLKLADVIEHFVLRDRPKLASSEVSSSFTKSLKHWVDSFGSENFGDIAAREHKSPAPRTRKEERGRVEN